MSFDSVVNLKTTTTTKQDKKQQQQQNKKTYQVSTTTKQDKKQQQQNKKTYQVSVNDFKKIPYAGISCYVLVNSITLQVELFFVYRECTVGCSNATEVLFISKTLLNNRMN